MNEQALVSKVWNYAHVLRDDGVSYGDYLGQISFLLFLKMDEERTKYLGEPSALPEDCQWDTLRGKSGAALEAHYREVLEKLSRRDDIVGTLFLKAENKIGDPAKLQRLVSLIDGETWMGLNVDVKGTIYEGLLERNAGEVKSGAGQYFTPRPVIQAMGEVVDPDPGETVCDPAVGTGGFLLAAYEHVRTKPGANDRAMARRMREESFFGTDIVAEVVRLCAMNLYLHGIGGAQSPVKQADALLSEEYNHTGMSVRKWTLGSLAGAYLRLKFSASQPLAAHAEQAQQVERWLGQLADRVVADWNAYPKERSNNHNYWAAWSVMASAVILDRRDLFDWAVGQYRHGMAQVTTDGYLPRELVRETRALSYHNYSIGPLLMVSAFAQANGLDLRRLEQQIEAVAAVNRSYAAEGSDSMSLSPVAVTKQRAPERHAEPVSRYEVVGAVIVASSARSSSRYTL